jgi:hypothetical protein
MRGIKKNGAAAFIELVNIGNNHDPCTLTASKFKIGQQWLKQ